MNLGVGDRPADGDGATARFDSFRRGPDGRLRGTVEVPEFAHASHQCIGQFAAEGFTTAQPAKARAALPVFLEEQPPGGRSRLHQGGPALGELQGQRRAVACTIVVDQFDPRAGQEREVQLESRDIEGNGRHRSEHVLGGDPGFAQHRLQEIQ
jgi:hypothetical protein